MRKSCKRNVREVHIPITRQLLNEFGQELHFALMTAELGSFSKATFDKIGGCLNCIYGALDLKPPKDASIKAVIEGAMRAMNECGKRGDRMGVWTLNLYDRAAVSAGVRKAEEVLPTLDVMTLYKSMQMLKIKQMEEERLAA
jgi:hypothetical protein